MSLWLIAGLVLLISEMLTASFYLVFIALGCLVAALAATLGTPLWVQTVIAAGFSMLGATALRGMVQRRLVKASGIQSDLGQQLRADEAIAPHQQARINYQGSSWLATNMGLEPIQRGDHVSIVGVDGNILLVKKVH